MKPFNLNAAKRGEKVVTRDGRPVRILCFDAKGIFPIVGLIYSHGIDLTYNFSTTGRLLYDRETENDLFMADEKQDTDNNH